MAPGERAQRILARVRRGLWLRRGLLASSGAASVALGVAHLARSLGFFISPTLYLAFFVPLVLSVLWPLPWEKRLFWVGRRLRLGGKLAGLAAALNRGTESFLVPLLADLRVPLRRLYFPEALALFPPLLLGVLLVVGPTPVPRVLVTPEPPAQELPQTAEEEEKASLALKTEKEETAIPEIPQLPPGFSGSPPYPHLLSALFGEEVSLEEAVERLAQEEGLLRRLAELLREAQETGLTGEATAEIGEILEELARPDVRETLSQELAEGEEGLAQAEEAVAAALEGLARLQGEATGPEGQGSAQAGGELGDELAYENPDLWGEVVPDVVPNPSPRPEREEAEEGAGLGVGTEEGEEVATGAPEAQEREAQVVSAEVRPGEGPVRTGIHLAFPGESAATGPEIPAGLTPQQVELLLREGALPPELRELVRRYFELLAGGGS